MATARIRLPFYVEGGDASADIVGNWINIEGLDNVAFQAVWSDGVAGTFVIEVSEDERQTDAKTNVPSGRLGPTALTYSGSPTPSGTAGSFYFTLTQVGAPWIRLRFVADGGGSTGTLNVGASAKGL